MDPNLDSQITALQFNVGALHALLGGSAKERRRFFEIHKGITTPAVFEVLAKELEQVNAQIAETQLAVKGALTNISLEAGVRG